MTPGEDRTRRLALDALAKHGADVSVLEGLPQPALAEVCRLVTCLADEGREVRSKDEADLARRAEEHYDRLAEGAKKSGYPFGVGRKEFVRLALQDGDMVRGLDQDVKQAKEGRR